jgi:hypothetical protein
MRQHLIVEGKDYFAIGELCKLHFPIPKGYTEKTQKEFLKGGKGFDETLNDFINTFDTPDLTNIALIVDADFKGVNDRFKAILSALSEKMKVDVSKYMLSTEGVVIEANATKIGIWIMPDNQNNGYLEHFIEMMIEENDDILHEAKSKVFDLLTKEYCRFTDIKSQKAIIYSWLAWQETPGLPFGTAMKAGALNRNADSVKPFLKWIERIFEF